MRYNTVADPVYSPNSKGGPRADTERYGEPAGWHTDGEMVRTAYILRSDDDWVPAGTLVRDVMDDAERDRLVDNIVGHLLDGVTEPVLERGRLGAVPGNAARRVTRTRAWLPASTRRCASSPPP